MKNTRFPVTIGLISLPASSVSAQTVTVVRELLGKLQARSASGMTLILPNYRQLSEAFSSMTTGTGVRVVRLDPPANQVSSNEFSIVDLSGSARADYCGSQTFLLLIDLQERSRRFQKSLCLSTSRIELERTRLNRSMKRSSSLSVTRKSCSGFSAPAKL